MIFECPGARMFKQPKPEAIKCPFCGMEAEIWTDEVKTICPGCKKTIIRQQGQSCLDWCKFAKDCVGEKVYNKYMKNRIPRPA